MKNLGLATAGLAENQKFAEMRQQGSSAAIVENSAVALVVQTMPFRVKAGAFFVLSSEEPEVDEKIQLVKGAKLVITSDTGRIIHENVRGILPLGKAKHLVRGDDGYWRVFDNTGKPKGKKYLKKVNLTIGQEMLFFDEHGKIRRDAWDPYYGEPLHF